MPKQEEPREGQRIAKVMARAGLCSRRDAEQWIAEGRVSVNGQVLTSPAFNVGDADAVSVDGEPLRKPERTRLFLFHKPRGLVTTAKDPEGRRTIFDALPAELPRVVAVGRLDINTEGLLLLTNDGGLARVLELPATGWLRRYRVRAHGEVTQERLDALRDGVTIDGIDYRGIEARFERQQGANVWMTMGLREGKNREIKRVLEHMGLGVNRLIRVSFGPFELADIAEGDVVETRTRVLRDQLGPKLARQAGANFDAPEEAPAPLSTEAVRADRTLPPAPRERVKGDEEREAPSRKRKHVTVLRAEAREGMAGPRKRISRATTSDRKGRSVAIERVSLAKPPAPPRRPPASRRRVDETEPRSRTTRDVAGQRRNGAPRRAYGEDAGKPDQAPRRAYGEGFAKPDRAPRGEGGERRSRDGAPRRPHGEGFAKPERAPRAEGGGRREEGRSTRDSAVTAKRPRPRDGARPPYGKGPPRDNKPRAPRGR